MLLSVFLLWGMLSQTLFFGWSTLKISDATVLLVASCILISVVIHIYSLHNAWSHPLPVWALSHCWNLPNSIATLFVTCMHGWRTYTDGARLGSWPFVVVIVCGSGQPIAVHSDMQSQHCQNHFPQNCMKQMYTMFIPIHESFFFDTGCVLFPLQYVTFCKF